MHGVHFLSKMFRPATAILPEKHAMTSRGHRLLLYTGLVHGCARGTLLLSPTLLRAMEKTTALIDRSMSSIDAERLAMPCLGDGKLWKRSGRWGQMKSEIFRLRDRQEEDLCLSPTHEEEVTNYVASAGIVGHRHLPVRLYQITTKFRDEGHPKFGLLRSREFLMKDLYTFDADRVLARDTYDAVCDAYTALFHQLKLPTVKVEAMTGLIGGNFSHEFHIPASIGEDELLLCRRCGHGRNMEAAMAVNGSPTLCPTCMHQEQDMVQQVHAIEVGHCFLLGEKYSAKFGALTEGSDRVRRSMQMGCFGIGVSRLVGAALEVLCEDEELRWPRLIAPFRAAVILQKEGAKDALGEADASSLIASIAGALPHGDVIVDDRPQFTIGRKLVDLRRLGVPHIVIAKQKETRGHFEIVDVYARRSEVKSQSEIMEDLTAC